MTEMLRVPSAESTGQGLSVGSSRSVDGQDPSVFESALLAQTGQPGGNDQQAAGSPEVSTTSGQGDQSVSMGEAREDAGVAVSTPVATLTARWQTLVARLTTGEPLEAVAGSAADGAEVTAPDQEATPSVAQPGADTSTGTDARPGDGPEGADAPSTASSPERATTVPAAALAASVSGPGVSASSQVAEPTAGLRPSSEHPGPSALTSRPSPAQPTESHPTGAAASPGGAESGLDSGDLPAPARPDTPSRSAAVLSTASPSTRGALPADPSAPAGSGVVPGLPRPGQPTVTSELGAAVATETAPDSAPGPVAAAATGSTRIAPSVAVEVEVGAPAPASAPSSATVAQGGTAGPTAAAGAPPMPGEPTPDLPVLPGRSADHGALAGQLQSPADTEPAVPSPSSGPRQTDMPVVPGQGGDASTVAEGARGTDDGAAEPDVSGGRSSAAPVPGGGERAGSRSSQNRPDGRPHTLPAVAEQPPTGPETGQRPGFSATPGAAATAPTTAEAVSRSGPSTRPDAGQDAVHPPVGGPSNATSPASMPTASHGVREGAPAMAAPVPPHEQIAHVVRPLLRGEDGTYRLRLQLNPEQLGSVSVTLELRAGEVAVSMQAGESASRDLLRDNLDQLRALLQQSGVNTGTLDVGDRSPDSRWNAPPGDGTSGGDAGGHRQPPDLGSNESRPEDTVNPASGDLTGALDLRL